MHRPLVPLTLFLALLLGCAQDTISRDQWRSMPSEDRILYVNTLIGGERAKDAKGDRGLPVTRTAEEYVRQIDEAYGRGETRPVHEVFAEIAR